MWVILMIFVIIIFVPIIINIRKWGNLHPDNPSIPKITTNAKVVTKRIEVYDNYFSRRSYTKNYVTFEFENGDRLELVTTGQLYGMLVEGDLGVVVYRSMHCLGFTRDK